MSLSILRNHTVSQLQASRPTTTQCPRNLINDLPDVVDCSIRIFADGTKMYIPIQSIIKQDH